MSKELIDAYRLVLQDIANWRRDAIESPDEFQKRDNFLCKLDSIARQRVEKE